MPEQPTCATCRYWKADYFIDDKPSESGSCLRMPPQIIVTHDRISENYDGPGKIISWDRHAVWPDTQHDDWCGEHRVPILGPFNEEGVGRVPGTGPLVTGGTADA